MGFFTETRLNFGNSILRKKAARLKRKSFYRNFGSVRTIGIVWDASRSEDFSVLSRFHQKMHERNIEVTVIGYYPGKELPEQLTAIRYLTCMRKQDISFFFLPVSNEAEKFINTRFDLLIDVNFQKLFPLIYISRLSAAGFKVGIYDTEKNADIFDLMMELKKPVKTEEYFLQAVTYLEMINSDTKVEAETI